MEYLELTKIVWEIYREILTSLSAIVVAIVAVLGLSTWKKKMVGKDSFDLAKRVLCAVYDLRSAINYVRGSLILSSETTKAKEALISKSSTPSEYERKEALYSIRWEKINTASKSLYSECLEAEALWGDEFVNITKPLLSLVHKLSSSIDSYIFGIQYPESLTKEEVLLNASVMLGKPWDPSADEFNKELEEAIKNIQDYLRPYINMKKN